MNPSIFFGHFPVHRFLSSQVDLGFWQTNKRHCLLPVLKNRHLCGAFLEVPPSRLKQLNKCLLVLKYVSFLGEKKNNQKPQIQLKAQGPQHTSYPSPECMSMTVFRGVKSDTLECFIALSLCLVSHSITLHITS